MSGMFDILFQNIKDRFPKLNWKLGSVVRSLLVDPLEKIGTDVDLYVNKLVSQLDLETLLDSPVGKEEALDAWMARLNIAEPQVLQATGTVAVLCASDERLTIAEGTAFTWSGDVSLYASEQVTYGEGSKSFTRVGDSLFLAEIPVISNTDTPVTLDVGSPLNWGSAPDQVIDVYVVSPITGGSAPTVQAKSKLIRAHLSNPTVCGASAIRASLIRKYGAAIVDVELGPSVADNTKAVVPVYIKQSAMPRVTYEQLIPSTSEDRGVVFSLDTTGVLTISGIFTDKGDAVVVDSSTQFGVLGDYGSKFVAKINEPTPNTSYSIRYTVFDTVKKASSWLNSTQCGSPVQLKSKTPVYGKLKMSIDIGGANLDSGTKAAICEYVCSKDLDKGVTDSELREILSSRGYTLGAATVFVADLLHNGEVLTVTQTGAINVTGRLGIDGMPVALYCSIDNIGSY